jgi:hypothetical protein
MTNASDGLYITLKIGIATIDYVPPGQTPAAKLFASADVRAEMQVGFCPPPPEPGSCVFVKASSVTGPNALVPGKLYDVKVSGSKKAVSVDLVEGTTEAYVGLRVWTKPSLPQATAVAVDLVGAKEPVSFEVLLDVATPFAVVAQGASAKAEIERVRLSNGNKEMRAKIPASLTAALGFTIMIDYAPVSGALAAQVLEP